MSDFNATWIFSTDFFFFSNAQITNLMKIRPVGAELFHADGQTDRRNEAKSPFSQLCERFSEHNDFMLYEIA